MKLKEPTPTMIGTSFWELRDTMTNMPKSRIWEVVEEVEPDVFSCKLLADKDVRKLNPEYRERWTREAILVELKRTPIYEHD